MANRLHAKGPEKRRRMLEHWTGLALCAAPQIPNPRVEMRDTVWHSETSG